MPVTSFSMAVSTFVPQNIGAGKKHRAWAGARFSMISAAAFATAIGALFFLTAPTLISAFNTDPEVIRFGTTRAQICSLFYGLIFSASGPLEVAHLGGSYAPFLFGKVVDMFYFPLWTWPDWVPWLGGRIFFEPVFNFADSCVTVGAIYLILFQWKFFAKEDEK